MFAQTQHNDTMHKPICIIRSVLPDKPAPTFNDWATYVHMQLRQYESERNQLNTIHNEDTLEETH
jgi:hypothetical protein